ncbi:hypothetical protein L1987_11940 [Smallanthus sonchifolius]|uniref:Uncharacterized protein n=1 Tax=Smallanthus sonchifolius TaxID=185202 RepID=A0ACB9JCQ7_9ASTR|nr:hypothetical protein L1987_11940 [Smallanthus sonchifolius]
MPPKRKRGTAKCLKMIKDPKDFKIEFDSNGLAIGENAAFRKKIPYYQLVKDIDKQLYNDVWVSLKQDWNIPNDDAKSTIIKLGKVAMRNFRYTLVNKYTKKDKSPIKEYEDLDMSHWDSFVSKALSEDFEYCKEIEMKENGTYYEEGKDVVTENCSILATEDLRNSTTVKNYLGRPYSRTVFIESYIDELGGNFSESDIYGTIDYIFGNAAVVFQNCSILATEDLRNSTTVKNYLGRPYSRTVFIESYIDELIDPNGWIQMVRR